MHAANINTLSGTSSMPIHFFIGMVNNHANSAEFAFQNRRPIPVPLIPERGFALLSKETIHMKNLLLAAAAVVMVGGFAMQAQANHTPPALKSAVVIQGGSSSHGGGSSQSGGATTTTSGTTFGGSATNGLKTSTYETNGPSLSDGSKTSSFSSGLVVGSTYQTSSTNGAAHAGSGSTSGVVVCAGLGC